MEPKTFFVLVTSSMGLWLGKVTEDNYTDWKEHRHALTLYDVRGLNMQPVPGSKNTISINIGPTYPGDTKQLEIVLFPSSVEIIGEIESDAQGNKSCAGNNTLFSRYSEALAKWKAALANLVTATPVDLENLKNVTKFPGKDR